MRADIHPDYREKTVRCGCGHTFVTRSTYPGEELRISICNECHPFYTGKDKFIDSEGRVDQFLRRYGLKQAKPSESS